MIPLLVLLPVLLLIIAALGIFILQQVRPGIGYAWLIATVMAIVTVGVTLFLRLRLPLQLIINPWQTFTGLANPVALRLDYHSWPYAFALAALALAFIMTDAARLETEARPMNWAAGLAFTALGMLAVMSANPYTLVITWTAVDLIESLMVFSTSTGRRMGEQTVAAFSVRVGGTLLVILAILFARSQALPFDLSPIPSSLAIFMLLAAGMRLGVLPLNIPYTREVYVWRGLGNVMRMIGPASSLVVLGRMPEQVVPVEWKPFFLILTALAALYGSGMWMMSDSELNGRPFWFIALAALAVASVINGNPQASISWGLALIFSGSVIFFFSARRRQILFIPLLSMLGIAGLPYNPAASGWFGLASGQFDLSSLAYLATVLFLIWGYLRHTIRARDELYRMERWVHTVYPAGLMALVLAHWFTGVYGWPGSFTPGVWWTAITLALVSAFGGILAFSFRRFFTSKAAPGLWVSVLIQRIGAFFGTIFRLDWLYRFIAWLYRVVQSVILVITAMFEGDGGILWSLVILALLISLIRAGAGGTP